MGWLPIFGEKGLASNGSRYRTSCLLRLGAPELIFPSVGGPGFEARGRFVPSASGVGQSGKAIQEAFAVLTPTPPRRSSPASAAEPLYRRARGLPDGRGRSPRTMKFSSLAALESSEAAAWANCRLIFEVSQATMNRRGGRVRATQVVERLHCFSVK